MFRLINGTLEQDTECNEGLSRFFGLTDNNLCKICKRVNNYSYNPLKRGICDSCQTLVDSGWSDNDIFHETLSCYKSLVDDHIHLELPDIKRDLALMSLYVEDV